MNAAYIGIFSVGQQQFALDTVGGAIITAAVDARRAGFLSPLPRDVLKELRAFYLDPRLAHLPGGSGFGEALAWATQPVEGASSCLTPLGAETYAPFDYLLDYAQATISTPSVPAAVWPVLLAHARFSDLPSLGRAAYQAGRLDISETAFRRAERTRDLILDTARTHPNWGRLRIYEELRACGHDLDEPEVNYVLYQHKLPNLHL